MRIGIDIRALMEGKTTGVETYLVNLLQALFKIDRENQYILFVNSWKGISLPKFDYPNVTLKITRFPNKLFNLMQRFFSYPKIDQLLGDCDLFFSPHWRATALRSTVPLVVTFHDLFFEIMPQFFTWRRRLWHKFMNYRHAARRATKIISVSENTKRDLVRLYGINSEKIEVVYSGVNPPNSSLFLRRDQSESRPEASGQREGRGEFFLYFGTFEPRKNIQVVVAAYEQYYELSDEKRRLVLAGSAGWKTNLRIPENLRSKISVRQNVSKTEKTDLYSGAFAFLFPSFYEGFGFPVLEAAAAGVPVISGYGGSLQEIAGDFSLFVNPLRTAQITRAMCELERDNTLYENLKSRGLEAVKSFTWQKTAKQTLHLFSQILNSKF